MFRERIKMVGWFFVYFFGLSTLAGVFGLIFNHFMILERLRAVIYTPYTPYVALGLFIIMVLYYIGKFVNWLFIQPFRNRGKKA